MDKKRILVIDDEADLTLLVKLNLERTGQYEVHEVNKALSSVEAARQYRPDLILLDVMMPDRDGGDVAADLKADPELKDIPVVFLTATVLKEEVDAGNGMISGHPFIPKPVEVQSLLECIEKQLKN